MPQLPINIADAAPTPSRVSGEMLGGDRGLGRVGQAISLGGKVVADANDRLFHAEQSAKGDLAKAKASIALNQAMQSIQDGNDYASAEEQFAAAVESQKGGGAELRGPYAADFKNYFDTLSAERGLQMHGWVKTKRVDAGAAAVAEATDTRIAEFGDTGNTQLLADAEKGWQQAVAHGLITEQQRVNLRNETYTKAAADYGAKLINIDPIAAQDHFRTDPFFNSPLVPERQRVGLLEAGQSEAAERQRVELQQMAYTATLKAKADIAQDNANFLQVLNRTEPMSPEEIRQMDWKDATQQATAMNWSAAQIANASRATPVVPDKTNWAYYDYLRQLRHDNPEGFVSESLDLNLLNDKHKEFWMKEQTAVASGQEGSGVFSFSERTNQAWTDIKDNADIGLWNSDLDETHRGLFDSIVEKEFERFRSAHDNKKPTGPEFTKILNQASVDFNKQAGEGNVLAIPPGASRTVMPAVGGVLEPIPDAEERLIISALQARGEPVTRSNIRAMYRLAHPE